MAIVTAFGMSGTSAASAAVGQRSTVARAKPAAAQEVDCTIKPSTAADAHKLTGGRLGSRPRAGLGAEEGPYAVTFLKQLLEYVAEDKIYEGAGWVLNLILGGDGGADGPSTQDLADMINQQSQKLDAIETSIANLADQLTNAEYAIQAQLAKSTYDLEVASENQNISQIQTWSQAVCELNNDASDYLPTDQHAKPYVPDTQDLATISAIRNGSGVALQNLSNALLGNGNGAEGIIATYRNAFWATQNAATGGTASEAIWTGAYLQSIHALIDYYVGLAVSLMNDYTEANHWDTPTSNPPLPIEHPDKIVDLYRQLRLDLQAWTYAATNNLPAIPSTQAVDVRTGTPTPTKDTTSTYNRWTINPVVLPGTNSEQYCVHAGQTCLFNLWDPAATDTTTVGGRLVPAVEPISAYLAAGTGGYSGWHLPTVADWGRLVSATYDEHGNLSGLNPQTVGAAAWAHVEQIPILENQSVASPDGTTVRTVAPVDVDDPTHSVLTFNGPTSTSSEPDAPEGLQYAGNLALETTVQATPLDLPEPPSTGAGTRVPTRHGTAPALTAGRGSRAAQTVREQPPAGMHRLRGNLDHSTTFTSSGTCGANAFTQPAGANAVKVVVQGGHGGSGGGSAIDAGGVGGVVTATIPLAAGATVYAQVGGAGGDGQKATRSEGRPGAGGVGGGGPGGTYTGSSNVNDMLGGGGGGASGISADSDCQQWLALAGGGGGGGGVTGSQTEGYAGGSGCPNTSCKAHTPTDDRGGSIRGKGAGDGGAIVKGGAGGTYQDYQSAGTGADGTRLKGGQGGIGATNCATCDADGGSGGGGGGGWGGGGGGGGSFNNYSGAGGAGGGSYVIPGVGQRSFKTASGGSDGSVSITPVVAPEYVIGTYSAAELPPTGYMLTSPAKAGDDLTRTGRVGDAHQQWALLNVGADKYDNQYYSMVSSAGPCAQGATSDNESSGPVTAETCELGNGSQAWTFLPQAADVWNAGSTTTTYWNYQMETYTGFIVAQAELEQGAPVTMGGAKAVSPDSVGQRWGLLVDPGFSIWALPSDQGGLPAPAGSAPTPTHGSGPTRADRAAPAGGVAPLANTGFDVAPTLLCGLALIAIGAVVLAATRPRRFRSVRRLTASRIGRRPTVE